MFSAKRVILSILILSVIVISGCGSANKWENQTAEEAWLKIMKLYNKGRYLDSIDRLEIFLINHAGAAMADSAQFILAESHYNLKEYIIAASEYQKIIVGPLAEISEYKLAICYYELSPKTALDQTYTVQAMETCQMFIEDFPESEYVKPTMEKIAELRLKLGEKEYENGRLYHKMGEYSSARIYYDSVMENYYDTPYAPLAQFYKADAFSDAKDWKNAIAEYSLFLEKFSDHEMADRALRGLNRARENYQKEDKEEQEELGEE